jgi:hypothetical protein
MQIAVSGSAQKRSSWDNDRQARVQKLHADVRCTVCRHQWWSRHPDALRRSKEADRIANNPVQE